MTDAVYLMQENAAHRSSVYAECPKGIFVRRRVGKGVQPALDTYN